MISLTGQHCELRRQLIIENETISGHCDRVTALKQQFNHTIRCVARPTNGTCVTYALGLLDHDESLCIEMLNSGVRPGTQFMHWLLDAQKLRELNCVEEGALALYFSGDEWKHIGVVRGRGRVVSKWGTYAVFDHQYSEVSAQYGDSLRFFAPLAAVEAAQCYFDFGCDFLDLKDKEIDRLANLVASGGGQKT